MWNREVFGKLNIRINLALDQIRESDEKAGQGGLNSEEEILRGELKNELESLLLKEEISWKQKSRVQWLKEGDKNTKFFHRSATAHRTVNQIRKITLDGDLLEDKAVIQEGIVGSYRRLYAENGDWRPNLDGVFFTSLEQEDRTMLEQIFLEEVLSALRSMEGDKAPSPDGFSMAFLQQCWEVIKEDIMQAFQFFHASMSFEKSFNASFLVLLPKKNGAGDLKDFRPISLIGSVYKLIAKGAFSSVEESDGQDYFRVSKCFCRESSNFRCFVYR